MFVTFGKAKIIFGILNENMQSIFLVLVMTRIECVVQYHCYDNVTDRQHILKFSSVCLYILYITQIMKCLRGLIMINILYKIRLINLLKKMNYRNLLS